MFWSGISVLAVAGMLLLVFFFLNLWFRIQRWQRQKTLQCWRPLMMAGLYQQAGAIPPILRRDLSCVLELWVHLHTSLDDAAQINLAQFASQAQLPSQISRALSDESLQLRLLAIRAAGRLKLASVWEQLLALLDDESREFSLASASAMVQIDPDRALPLVINRIRARSAWRTEEIMAIFLATKDFLAARCLRQAIANAPADEELLLPFLARFCPDDARSILNRILSSKPNEALLIKALDLVDDRHLLEAVRPWLSDANWLIRLHAVKAFGRIGAHDEVSVLAGMVGDPQWWVRYRSAQALLRLPGVSIETLLQIKDTMANHEARDMLHLVMAEQSLWGVRGVGVDG